ncbi:hypothetical protein [Thermasporomyces composti]|uniref:hypothetical protein n=1 Tax=Thermasporomyces composti TaxID=696763 RepID=UPI001B872B93|nr:hypothetical protein [Thermasporomyces composti]
MGITLDKDHYLRDVGQGLGSWAQARAAGIDEQTIARLAKARDEYYQEYLRTKDIEIDGVLDTLAELSRYARMAIVTTASVRTSSSSTPTVASRGSWTSFSSARTTRTPSLIPSPT